MTKANLSTIGSALIAVLTCGVLMAQSPGVASTGAAAAPNASQVTFGSNLFVEPCNTCNYDSNAGGFHVWGPDNCSEPGHAESVAVAFISAATGIPERVSAALNLTNASACPTNKVTLSIYTDACYPRGPGRRLVSGVATVPTTSCALATAKLRNAPSLTQGTKYWVVATTDAKDPGFDGIWYASNDAQIGGDLGAGWFQFTGGTPAFMVQGAGSAAPDRALDTIHRPFGSNLFVEPCNTCNYDSEAGGFPVWGADNCSSLGATEWVAVPFVSAINGVPKRISASINLTDPAQCPTNKVTLSIYTDACYPIGPGAPLVSGIATIPPAPCVLAVAALRNSPSLTKGTKYWVVATTNSQQAGLDAIWYASNNAQIAGQVGDGWFQFTGDTPGFIVQ